ncbi:DNA-directed RNA polymerase subunit delta [Metabacillus arenae]|uniref:Probable DNA-directed RNA polymerase subunit delta n=1 Tax=Metabacillus arenae TaxID=2771434 RepID=A0A926NKF1_9BACI|nr:DNA-directed RNA polymerase subunit delta [Metabacillus arenae]MBD1379692.1 DNA-directed RNA polymerase subunit delta [Metabacillus arenae]
MKLSQYSPEELKETALVELAYLLFEEKRKPVQFTDLIKELKQLLGLSQEELEERIPQFYTDLNIDGRFIMLSDGSWGLRSWYPYDQLEEETQHVVKTKKKKSKKVKEEDLDDYEEMEDEAVDYDDDDEDFEESDLDEDLEDDELDEDEDLEDDDLIDDDFEDMEDDDDNLEDDEDEEND